jgi:NADPH:quinone reductase-like Zn-dependent oxidoreductase
LRDGVLSAPIDSTYPIERIKDALAHAQQAGRHGKILILPNGSL